MQLKKKGQLFSIDFVIAVSILALSLAIAVQAGDLVQKKATNIAKMQDSVAETTAQQFVSPVQGFSYPAQYCFQYSNGTGNCAGFTCAENTFVSKRLVECAAGACGIEVRVCG